MPQVDRAGIFKAAPPTEYALEKSKEGAWGVRFRFELTDYLNGSEWVDWSVYGQHAYGTVWFLRKDGKPNVRGVETLRDVLGWDGDPASIENRTWTPPACQVVVKADEYNGKTRFRVEWINPWTIRCRSGNDSDVADLKARFGPTLRACLEHAVNAPKPNGKPFRRRRARPIDRPRRKQGAGLWRSVQRMPPSQAADHDKLT